MMGWLLINPISSSKKYSRWHFKQINDLVNQLFCARHAPYVIILIKVTEDWVKSHEGSLPSTKEEKREFKVYMVPNLYFRFLLLFMNVIQLGSCTS
ncbi:NEDD8-activating enzyme E1 regulatory subunit [Melia azedarach]|uniref:NEDD8-activating enzyme E1 regulatory subunit n=1 Tax=Melia azedarach TaxID=155640 RepID=A0ACC1WUT8_MELAZ|nr:NEDD8-activating enzyme E1 regulatory subunit [Melia azedarach]